MQNKAILQALFAEKGLSAGQIAQITGWAKTSITDALKEHEITRAPKTATKARYGWKVQDGALVPHVRQQAIIQKALKLREQGYPLNRIAKELNATGVPSAQGKQWDHKMIRTILERATGRETSRL